jgi:hypothetical protein
MGIKRFLSSRWFYYLLIVSGLFIFIFGILPFWIHNQVISLELGENLFAEAWGILFTVLLLTIGIELGERLRWKPLKDRVLGKIGSQIRNIFLDLIPLIETSKDTTLPSKTEELEDKLKRMISRHLKEFREKKEIELSERGKKTLSDKRSIDIYIKMFQEDKQSLNELEMKYSNLLKEPQIMKSIINIQKGFGLLIWFVKDGYLWREDDEERETYFKHLATTIHRIIKEICNLDKLGIEVYSLTD